MAIDKKLNYGLVFDKDTLAKSKFKTICEQKNKKILMTCKPKTSFHLGNIWMYHKIRQFLECGFKIDIIIILFDENERLSEQEKDTLLKKAVFTKRFLSEFFENSRMVNIKLSTEVNIPERKIAAYHAEWKSIYDRYCNKNTDKNDHISKLITEKNQLWVSNTHTYVSKCIAIYTTRKADIVLCGKKHDSIVSTFRAVAKKMKLPFPDVLYVENLQDLTGKRAMDGNDSGPASINLLDSEEIILSKILKSPQKLRRIFLNSALDKLLLADKEFTLCGVKTIASEEQMKGCFNLAPDCINGVVLYHLIDAISTYNQLLRKVKEYPDIKFIWEYERKYSDDEKQRIEKILESIYYNNQIDEICIGKEFTEGKSGSRVFEIELYPQNTKNSFKAIFKVGDYIDMEREKDLFDKINGNCDNSFTPVLRISELKDWKIGIIYKHANVFLNARLINLKEYIEKRIENENSTILKFITCLFKRGLQGSLHKHGISCNTDKYCDFYNRILPAGLEVGLVEDAPENAIGLSGDTIFQLAENDRFNTENIYRIRIAQILKLSDDEVVFLDKKKNKIRAFLSGTSYNVQNLRLNYNRKKPFDIYAKIEKTRRFFYDELLADVDKQKLDMLLRQIYGEEQVGPLEQMNDILSLRTNKVRKSLIHGDLNLTNILILDENNYSLIDYQYTDYGLTNYDFIKFEVELRTQLLNELDIEAYIAFEGRLAEVNNEKKFLGQKAENLLLLIKEIRKIYFETDTTADAKKHYAIGMYLYSLNCLKYFREDKTMKDKLYFTASLYLNKFRDQ